MAAAKRTYTEVSKRDITMQWVYKLLFAYRVLLVQSRIQCNITENKVGYDNSTFPQSSPQQSSHRWPHCSCHTYM